MVDDEQGDHKGDVDSSRDHCHGPSGEGQWIGS